MSHLTCFVKYNITLLKYLTIIVKSTSDTVPSTPDKSPQKLVLFKLLELE